MPEPAMRSRDQFLRPDDAQKLLKVSKQTLRNWEREGKLECLRTQGGHRRFRLVQVLRRAAELHGGDVDTSLLDGTTDDGSGIANGNNAERVSVVYARVSSAGQRADLDRQADLLASRYPHHRVIRDIGSGLNFNRRGLRTLVDLATSGRLGEVVVTHKDRLCRFGFELLEYLFRSCSDGTIVVLDHEGDGDARRSPERELVEDLLAVVTVFSGRLHGLRSHRIRRDLRAAAAQRGNTGTASDEEETEGPGEGQDPQDSDLS